MPGDRDPDRLTTLDELRGPLPWPRGGPGRFDRDAAELDAVRALRPRLRGFWERDEAGVVDLVNELLAEARAVPQLVDHDGVGWHVHATPADAPLARRMAVEAAMAVIDVVRAGELDRLTRLRGRRLRRRRRRPLAQPVAHVLRGRLRGTGPTPPPTAPAGAAPTPEDPAPRRRA